MTGINATLGEKLKSIAIALFSCINIKVDASDIQNIYRKSNNILVKLSNYDTKAKLIQHKTKNKIMTCNVWPELPNYVQVLVNNHTTPYFWRFAEWTANQIER